MLYPSIHSTEKNRHTYRQVSSNLHLSHYKNQNYYNDIYGCRCQHRMKTINCLSFLLGQEANPALILKRLTQNGKSYFYIYATLFTGTRWTFFPLNFVFVSNGMASQWSNPIRVKRKSRERARESFRVQIFRLEPKETRK